MCYRITQIVLIALAIFFAIAVFVPWQRLLFLNDAEATRWLCAKMILLPIPVLCVLGATWCATRIRSRHI